MRGKVAWSVHKSIGVARVGLGCDRPAAQVLLCHDSPWFNGMTKTVTRSWPMPHPGILIVGASQAGAQVATSLRERGVPHR